MRSCFQAQGLGVLVVELWALTLGSNLGFLVAGVECVRELGLGFRGKGDDASASCSPPHTTPSLGSP